VTSHKIVTVCGIVTELLLFDCVAVELLQCDLSLSFFYRMTS